MNVFRKNLACFLFASLAGCVYAAPEPLVGPGASETPVRSIFLSEKQEEGGNNCTIPAATDQTVYLNKGHHDCENDEMRYLQLDNVRSATVIYLESKDCDDEGGWVFVLKTTIDPISTPKIAIDYIASQPAGQIITRGVVLVDKRLDEDENTTGKLSCVRVEVSE